MNTLHFETTCNSCNNGSFHMLYTKKSHAFYCRSLFSFSSLYPERIELCTNMPHVCASVGFRVFCRVDGCDKSFAYRSSRARHEKLYHRGDGDGDGNGDMDREEADQPRRVAQMDAVREKTSSGTLLQYVEQSPDH